MSHSAPPSCAHAVPLATPKALLTEQPLSQALTQQLAKARQTLRDLIHGRDPRLLVIVGPCSIAQPHAALLYAKKLQQAAKAFEKTLFLVMRAYIVKPRTTLGWKGLIYDPYLTGQADINHGLRIARQLFIEINTLGMPLGTEWLDPFLSPYFADLVSWGSVGARTVESQIHRELASQLNMPIGFKNTTTGNIQVAIDAMQVARTQHDTLSLNASAHPVLRKTAGNPDVHLILRGSQQHSNYDTSTLMSTKEKLQQANLPQRIMIDCSHGNSQKDYRKQGSVIEAILPMLQSNKKSLLGVMIESHLKAGRQALNDPNTLTFGQSLTDPCLAWEDTLPLLDKLSKVSLEQKS